LRTDASGTDAPWFAALGSLNHGSLSRLDDQDEGAEVSEKKLLTAKVAKKRPQRTLRKTVGAEAADSALIRWRSRRTQSFWISRVPAPFAICARQFER
jgi:hypothetical protein